MVTTPDSPDTLRERSLREEALVSAHLHLVRVLVAEMANRVPRHVFRDDLTSAAMSALAVAARHFDPARGVAFDRYAVRRMRGALLDELRAHDWASRSVRTRARQVSAATESLTAELGRRPSREEIADRCGLDREALASVNQDLYRASIFNYDAMVHDGTGDELLPRDERSPDVVVLDNERKAYLIDAVAALPERLRQVVVGCFFEERSMQQLADSLGVTQSRVCQIRAQALSMIREALESQLDAGPARQPDRGGPRVAKRRAAYLAAVEAGSDFRTRVSYRDTVAGATSRLTRLTSGPPLEAAGAAPTAAA
ncbi:MAG TPA: sigma-70 family RNA polymerase sigma factor [Acidimicrobiales bacterium]